jgi:hypothetical protein
MPEDIRVPIISAVRTPLGFFTLGLLTLEAGLLIVASKATEPHRIGLFWGCLVLIFLTIVIVGLLAAFRPQFLALGALPVQAVDASASGSVYEVFLACPMAGFEDDERYREYRAQVMGVKQTLRTFCGIEKIYFPADEIPTMGDFGKNYIATRIELEALRSSRIFLMIYPEHMVSSVLFEAGYALGIDKLSIYFARTDQLPFLMQELQRLPHTFPQVRLYPSESIADVIGILKQNGRLFFDAR